MTTPHASFSPRFSSDRRAIHAVELMAATFAENPKLRGMIIVVTDEHDNAICKVNVPSQH